MSLSQASEQDLVTIQNVVRDPLTGRKVMIPFSSKAFFEGSLQPTIDPKNGQEQVLVKLSKENLVELSRSEAWELFETRIKAVQEKAKAVINGVDTSRGTKKPSKKSPKNDGGIESNRDSVVAQQQQGKESGVADTTDDDSVLPFFEIREELDDDGNEIRAEAINVAKELEYLQREESKQLDSAVRVVPSSATVMEPEEVTTRPGVISDERFEDLTSRLEELARLEEEAERNKTENLKSSKKLQGSGWGKGFLTKKPNTRKKAATTSIIQPSPAENQVVNDGPVIPERNKRVGFQEENNQVREIPRVGERSIASTNLNAPSRPIEQSVFSGVVQEKRPVVAAARPVTSGTGQKVEEEAPKKLSRFAQQRMEQGQEQKRVSKFAQQRQQLS